MRDVFLYPKFYSQMPVSRYPRNIPREERSYEVLYDDLEVFAKHMIKAKPMLAEKAGDGSNSDNISVRTIETNKERMDIVTYRMDGQDLQYVRSSGLGIEEDVFELIIDRLEKEWFVFVQRLINEYVEPMEPRTPCDICTGSMDEENNVLVICQGCSLVVHEDCYGVQDQVRFWLCRRCVYYGEQVMCLFCPSTNGGFKQTSDLRWGHVTCTMFNKSLSFDNPVSRDPIDVGSYKRETGCSFCDEENGTVVPCSYFMCKARYHVSCALDKCYFDLNNEISYCKEHDPLGSLGRGESRHIYSLRYFDYERLRYPPRIRRRVQPKEFEPSLFLTLCRLEPLATKSMVSRILLYDLGDEKLQDVLAVVSRYWESKRRMIGGPLFDISSFMHGNEVGKEWADKRRAGK